MAKIVWLIVELIWVLEYVWDGEKKNLDLNGKELQYKGNYVLNYINVKDMVTFIFLNGILETWMLILYYGKYLWSTG